MSKKAKTVEVVFQKRMVVDYNISYACPTCYQAYVLYSFDKSVTRFKCNCGQELIVNPKHVNGGATNLVEQLTALLKTVQWFIAHLCSSYYNSSDETKAHIDQLYEEFNNRWSDHMKELKRNNFL